MKYIGLHCGRSELRGVVCRENGLVLNTARLNPDAQKGIPIYLQNIVRLFHLLSRPYEQIAAVGIATTGFVDAESCTVLASDLPGYAGTDLRALIQGGDNLPVAALGRAAAALIGESRAGKRAGFEHGVLLWLGSRVESATMRCGRIFQGSSLRGGNWAAMQIPTDDGPLTVDEALSARSTLSQMAEAYGESLCSEEYRHLCRGGNAALFQVLDRFCDRLAVTVENIVAAEDPEVIFIGGEFSYWQDLFLPLLNQKRSERSREVPVLGVTLGTDSACIGAALWAEEQKEKR